MCQDAGAEFSGEFQIELCIVALKQIKCDQQICRADGDVHSGEPIDPKAWRISGNKVQNLILEFGLLDLWGLKPLKTRAGRGICHSQLG